MALPLVSVIIPTYNHVQFISTSIQSVLDQTFTDFELIVIDDGSSDNTYAAVKQFTDPRVKYIYQENRGIPAARNAGIKASSGQLLAFLDADDKFHPQKLQMQVTFLNKHPEIGLVYNSRFIIDSTNRCLMLQRAPATVTLVELVRGYPFTPSDVVIRQEWAFRVGLYDESFVLNSEDLDFHLRLAKANCKFAGVNRALCYRQIHTDRVFQNITSKLATFLRALDTVFSDPYCPQEVLSLRGIAFAQHYLTWAYQAALQDESGLALDYFRESIRLNPSLLDHDASPLLHLLIHMSIRDGGEHEPRLRKVGTQLPPEIVWPAEHCGRAIAHGYLVRGVRDVMWGRFQQGARHLQEARQRGARLDQPVLDLINEQLFSYAIEFGEDAAQYVAQTLTLHLRDLGTRSDLRRLRSTYNFNRAIRLYREGKYAHALNKLIRAVASDPKYLSNRGTLSVTWGSIVGSLRQSDLH